MRFLVYVLCGVLLAPTVWASDTAPSTKNGQVNTEEFHISRPICRTIRLVKADHW